jgi:hypothetical protein
MATEPNYTRPDPEAALNAWKDLLKKGGLPTELLWVFDENLCFEADPARPGGFRLGFQTAFTPPPAEGADIAYEHFAETEAPLVFYRLGSAGNKSVCVMLCDEWFAAKQESDGFIRRDDWRMLFRPGEAVELEEIKEVGRWRNRMLRDRPLHDLDFCMSLQAIHESLAHGRVLSTYERYALRFLHLWRRVLGQQE